MALPMMNPNGTSEAIKFLRHLVYISLFAVISLVGFNVYTYFTLMWHIGQSEIYKTKLDQCSLESTANASYIRQMVDEIKTCNKENIYLRDEYNVLRAKAEMRGILVKPLNDE